MEELSLFDTTNVDYIRKDSIKGYTLEGEIGKGATGIVFSAFNNNTGEKVAMKFLYPYYSKNKEYIRRLYRESEATSKINHPNVVKSYGCGCCFGNYYIIFEFISGKSLDYYIKKEGKFNERRAAEIILDIAKGLNEAHKYNIIHRDIKPGNILITLEDIIKITDFGLAKEEIDTSLTLLGTIVGTPCYISPEQTRGEPHLDIRTDLYALGITFYHIVVGEPPFAQYNTSLLLTKKIVEEIPEPNTLNPDLSKEVCYIITNLTKKDREQRYSEPQEVISDLEKYLKGEFNIEEKQVYQEIELDNKTVIEVQTSDIEHPVLQTILIKQNIPCDTKILKPGEILFYEDDESKDTYVLLKGQVEVLKAGRRIAVIAAQGTFIGEMSYLLNAPRSATVRAIDATVLLELKEKNFKKFLREYPELSYHLSVSLARHLAKTNEKLKEAQTALVAIREQYRFIKQELGI